MNRDMNASNYWEMRHEAALAAKRKARREFWVGAACFLSGASVAWVLMWMIW